MFSLSTSACSRRGQHLCHTDRNSIGSFYAFILSRNENVRLTVVARSNYDAVAANGIKITSENHGEHLIRPFKGRLWASSFLQPLRTISR